MAHAPSTPKTTIARSTQPIPLLFFGGGDETLEDGSRYNPSVISFIRDEWMHKQVQEREAEYTEYRGLRLFTGTWNVNGKFPREDLTPWLCDGADSDAEGKLTLPDVYIIGLQEMVDLTVTNVALGGQSGKRSELWISLLDRTLNDAAMSAADRFELVGTRYLVGVMIAVFVKSRFRDVVSQVQDAEAPVGMMGVMGNKGGVSIRLQIFDSTFCFVCAHLAAHRNAVAQRNADFASIMAKTEFRDEAALAAGRSMGSSELGKLGILDHDFVVWFGDFNYRIVETVSTERCFELACGGESDLEQLRQRDQLNIERAAQRSFHGFQEGPLTFRPTYKFQPLTSMYEQRPDKKLRAPAWCDRILWRASDPKFFRQLYYGSVDELLSSDHKAVHSIFEAAVKTIIRDKRAAVVADITRQLDAMENRTMPKVTVSETVIHIPDVVYGIATTKTITIENVGEVAATWRFVPKPEEKWFCKTWLSVEPAYGMIPPGATATVVLTVNIDDAVARDISLGRELAMLPTSVSGGVTSALAATTGVTVSQAAVGGLLEDILILRTERGRDYYLSVSAAALPTCFGCSLAQLARRPEPMRALILTAAATSARHAASGVVLGAAPTAPATAPLDLSAGSHHLTSLIGGDDTDLADFGSGGHLTATITASDATRKGSPLMSVPKEVWRLVDVLFSRGMGERGLFLAPGDAADIIEVRECLDTGEAFPPAADMLSVAQVLLDLLESLREPIIPCALFPGPDMKAVPVEALGAQILRLLSPLHYNVLVYLVRFGREVLLHSHENGATVEDLSYVLSRCMMRRIPHDEAPAHAPLGDPSSDSLLAASASSLSSASGRGGGGDEEDSGAALARFSLYADKGTRWEPSREEQEAMTRLFTYYLTASPLV